MAIEIKTLTCPNCGKSLNIKDAGKTKSIICDQCGSQIDLTGPDYAILGKVGERPEPRVTPFRVGMQGPIHGQPHEIIGRVVYRDDEGDVWDEWLLLSQAGEYVWISESENFGMALWHSFVPPEPVEPQKVRLGESIRIRGENIRARDVGHATIQYLEGELTWKAQVGSGMGYIEADSNRQRISIEFTETEVEFFWGEFLNAAEIQRAFGVPVQTRTPLMAFTGAQKGKASGLVGGFLTLLICILVMCVSSVIGGVSGLTSAAEICVTPTPNRNAQVLATPGPSPTPYCYRPTARPGSGGFFSTGGSSRSGSSGRSSGGGSHGGGGGGGGK